MHEKYLIFDLKNYTHTHIIELLYNFDTDGASKKVKQTFFTFKR